MNSPRTRRRGLQALTRTGNRLLRPGDFADLYVNPHSEFTRMLGTGALEKAAHGYYLLVPDHLRGRKWKPDVEAVALGIAVADYGREGAALVGISAARVLGALPRALATATVAIPKQRPPVATGFGEVRFASRKVETLDRQRVETAVVTGWVTTPEQTALDLADRPTLGGITPATAAEAIRVLARRVEAKDVNELARAQRKRGGWQRFAWIAGLPIPNDLRPGVPTRGLRNPARSPSDYGLIELAT